MVRVDRKVMLSDQKEIVAAKIHVLTQAGLLVIVFFVPFIHFSIIFLVFLMRHSREARQR